MPATEMTLALEYVPNVLSIYPKKNPGFLPNSMSWLAPDAASSWSGIGHVVVVSDMLRTGESSLLAVEKGRGALLPGFSLHSYGLAADVAVKETMALCKFRKKAELDLFLEGHGWYCYRRDHKLDWESWHYNFLGFGVTISPKVRTTTAYAELEVQRRYGESFKLDAYSAQKALAKLRMYGGTIDGLWGPRSKRAAIAFKRAWHRPNEEVGTLTKDDKRVLAFVAANRPDRVVG